MQCVQITSRSKYVTFNKNVSAVNTGEVRSLQFVELITLNDQKSPQHILRALRPPPGLLELAHSQATVPPKVTS